MSNLLNTNGTPIRDLGKELDELKDMVGILTAKVNALGQVLKLAVEHAKQQERANESS